MSIRHDARLARLPRPNGAVVSGSAPDEYHRGDSPSHDGIARCAERSTRRADRRKTLTARSRVIHTRDGWLPVGSEVVGRDVVQEFPELLDLVLLLVRDLDPGDIED